MFERLFSKKIYLGVDIGTASIKIAALANNSKGQLTLINYGILETHSYLERFNTALQTSTLKIFEDEVAGYLRFMINRMRLPLKELEIYASLPTFSAFTTVIDVPPDISEPELNQTIGFKAKQYLPLPLSSVTLDWLRIAPDELFLMAIPTDQIERFQNLFGKAGLNLTALEVEGISLARALSQGDSEPILIVDVGARSTGFVVARGGKLRFSNQTDFAGGSLTHVLSASLNIATRRAEDLKKQKGLSGLLGGADQELSTLLLPILDVIINEARRIKASHNFGRIILTGGGAKLPGLLTYMREQLDMKVILADPWSKIETAPALAPLRQDLGPNLAVALGLALRKFI